MEIVIFTVGFIIFGTYMFFLVRMINTQHKIQERENGANEINDNIDYDGHGNWGRFPAYEEKKKKNKKDKIY